jgi:hypothetical protein
MKMEKEEERLVPNVDFGDTLQVLGFYLDNYQMLSNLGW